MTSMTSTSSTTATRRHGARREWGPAKHDPEHPLHTRGAAVDLRDASGTRPDDN